MDGVLKYKASRVFIRSHWRAPIRMVILLVALTLVSATVRAKSRSHVVDIGGSTIVVKITEVFGNVSKVRAECVIPRPQKTVWRVLTDYDNLEHVITPPTTTPVSQRHWRSSRPH